MNGMEDLEKKELAREYQEEILLASYDVDVNSELRLSALLRFCQELSGRHLSVLELPYEKLRNEGMVFLFTRTGVKVHRMPTHRDIVKFITRPCGTVGSQFYREFELWAGEELLLEVLQSSVTVNPDSHKILRPKVFLEHGFYQGDLKNTLEKFDLPEGMVQVGERLVRYSDLDYNRHMNNAIYADVFLDFLPDAAQRRLKDFQIHYVRESLEAETLKLYAKEQENQVFFLGENPRGISFECKAVLETR